MSHFAEISGSGSGSITYTVVNVIVAEQNFIDSGAVGTGSNWVQTSYSGSIRKNYAGIGYTYDESRDAFIPPQPEPSASIPYVLDEDRCLWELSGSSS
jgi:hypothetical protein